jgi:hypothetical protein
MTTEWKVTKQYQLSHPDRLIILLAHPDLNPAKVIWNGRYRTYQWDGWELALDPKYHAGIDEAIRQHLEGRLVK